MVQVSLRFHIARRRLMRTTTTMTGVSAVLVLALALGAPARAERTPEETVEAYAKAMKDGDYAEAYKYQTKAMVQHKDAEVWVKETKYFLESVDLKVLEYEVFPGTIEGEVAKVPNIQKSYDKHANTLAANEYEIYVLKKEDGEWKIDRVDQVERPDERFGKKGS
jgi:hypothetical protein